VSEKKPESLSEASENLSRVWGRLKRGIHYAISMLIGNDDELEDVRLFQKKFGQLNFTIPGHLTKRKLKERSDFLQEELDEFKQACQSQDLALQADALIDLVYVAKGTAVMLGLPWETLWDDVQRANMEKVPGKTHRGHLVDAMKPPGWVGPRTMEILLTTGYQPNAWVDEIKTDWLSKIVVDEEKCRDDIIHKPQ